MQILHPSDDLDQDITFSRLDHKKLRLIYHRNVRESEMVSVDVVNANLVIMGFDLSLSLLTIRFLHD